MVSVADWAAVALAVLTAVAVVGGLFGWLWREGKAAKRETATSLYNAKKDVLDIFEREKKLLHERLDGVKHDLESSQEEFTSRLDAFVNSFSRLCDGLQSKLEHMTSTIIGQYVPRQEIDDRFRRMDEKQDRILTVLYDMKK